MEDCTLDGLKQRCQSSPGSLSPRALLCGQEMTQGRPRPGMDSAGLLPEEEETTSNFYLAQFGV